MDVRFLPQIFPKFNFNNSNKYDNKSQNSTVLPSTLSGLKADTISFSGNPIKPAVITFKEVIADGYQKKIPLYQILGKKFILVLDSIATKLESYGVHFDLEYCEINPVKGLNSYMSKMRRSGEVLDKIRATMYMDDPYDMNILGNYILPELRGCGYEIRGLEKGAKKKSKNPVVDFDIRLGGITSKQTEVLEEPLRNLISGPQKSGYEDIQMRLIDTTASAKNQVPHELLILFGKNTAMAKHDESYYVFDIVRELSHMHIMDVPDDVVFKSPLNSAKSSFNLIRSQLNANISNPLFYNAKKLDYEHNPMGQIPVQLSEATAQSLETLIVCLREDTMKYYKLEMAKINSKEYLPTIKKLIRQSAAFNAREDKRILPEDVAAKKDELIANLKEHKREDLKTIADARVRLKETIAKYSEQKPTDTKSE